MVASLTDDQYEEWQQNRVKERVYERFGYEGYALFPTRTNCLRHKETGDIIEYFDIRLIYWEGKPVAGLRKVN